MDGALEAAARGSAREADVEYSGSRTDEAHLISSQGCSAGRKGDESKRTRAADESKARGRAKKATSGSTRKAAPDVRKKTVPRTLAKVEELPDEAREAIDRMLSDGVNTVTSDGASVAVAYTGSGWAALGAVERVAVESVSITPEQGLRVDTVLTSADGKRQVPPTLTPGAQSTGCSGRRTA